MEQTSKANEELASIIRVNHAGEYGAKRIYAGQLATIKNANARSLIAKMQQQELEHLQYFEGAVHQYGVRPTALQPIWHVGGWLLGAATAAMGEKTAMACTVAVESVIAEHYESQIEATAHNPELQQKIKQFKGDELEHHATGLEYGAESSALYGVLYHGIRKITRLAIIVSSKI